MEITSLLAPRSSHIRSNFRNYLVPAAFPPLRSRIPLASIPSSPINALKKNTGKHGIFGAWSLMDLFAVNSFMPSSRISKDSVVTSSSSAQSTQVVQRTETRNVDALSEIPDKVLACPICHSNLLRVGPKNMTRRSISRSKFRCHPCRKEYSVNGDYVDLVITSGVKEYREPLRPGTEIFRSPFVSFVYERGWRQSFARAGFPGANEEFAMAQKYLQPAKGGVVLDISCGSGVFSRRLAKSGDYSLVVASDFSENMLRQASQFIDDDASLDLANIVLVRADVARLPFPSASLDAVHAGAALHCWPSPSLAVSEISRVLKPGGVFVATTFLAPRAPFADEFIKPFRKAIVDRQLSGTMKYWEAEELEELCIVCGLVNYEKDQRQDFIMLKAQKSN